MNTAACDSVDVSTSPDQKPLHRSRSEAAAGKGGGNRPAGMARRSGVVLFLTMSGRLLNFVSQVVLSNLLGLKSFGIFTYCNSILAFLGAVCLGGYSHTTVRYVAIARNSDAPGNVHKVIRLSLISIAMLTAIVCLVLIFFKNSIANEWLDKPEFAPYLIWILIALPGIAVASWLAFSLRAFRDVGVEAVVRHVSRPLILLGCLALFWLVTDVDLTLALIAMVASIAVTALFGLFRLRQQLAPVGTREDSTLRYGEMMKYAVPIWFSRFSGIIVNQADRLLIGALSTLSQVGIYHAAFRIADFQKLAIGSFVPVFSTAIAEAHARGDRDEIIHYYRMVVRWSLMLTMPIFLACCLFAAPILRVFGDEFVAGVPVLIIIAFSSLASASAGPAGQFLQMMGKERVEMTALVTAAIMVVALNLVLIPRYGATGAAVGSGSAVVSMNLFRIAALRRLLGVYPYSELIARLAGVSLLAGAATWLAGSWHLGLQAAVLFGAYAAGIWQFCLHPEDRLIVARIRSRFDRGRQA